MPPSSSSTAPAALVKQFLRSGAKAGVLFNQVRKQTIVGQQDMKNLAKTIGLPAYKHWLPLASAYEQFSSLGWSVVTGAERERVTSLAKEIIQRAITPSKPSRPPARPPRPSPTRTPWISS